MNKEYRIIIAVIASGGIIYAAYYGSYMPLKKSKLYINTFDQMQAVRSLNEFKAVYDPVINYPSPVGQDEIMANYLNMVAQTMGRIEDEKTLRALMEYVEPQMRPILEKGTGLNFSQNLYNIGTVYKVAGIKLNDEKYYTEAIRVFELGMEASPRRPLFLYGMFELYYAKRDAKKTKEIGEIILKYYPQEQKIKELLDKL